MDNVVKSVLRKALRYAAVVGVVALFASNASAIDFNVFAPGDTIRSSEVNENFDKLGAALEQDRTLVFPAASLSHSTSGTVVSDFNTGLLWEASFTGTAILAIPRPADWDGQSAVTLDLYFYPQTSASGSVDFFIRPRAFDVGEAWSDTGTIGATPVDAEGQSVLAKQSFTIPAHSFGAGELWYITMQRGGAGETYADAVILLSVGLTYTPGY